MLLALIVEIRQIVVALLSLLLPNAGIQLMPIYVELRRRQSVEILMVIASLYQSGNAKIRRLPLVGQWLRMSALNPPATQLVRKF